MAISKRTRYEVLRRDSFTCRYCGSKAPNVELHVDHVTPTALGGSDKPDNLVASCADCNFGKASTDPDAQTVADVSEDAVRWARARGLAVEQFDIDAGRLHDAKGEFIDIWSRWDAPLRYLPGDWDSTFEGWIIGGLSMVTLEDCFYIAIGARGVSANSRFRYLCGVAKNRIADIDAKAQAIIEDGEV